MSRCPKCDVELKNESGIYGNFPQCNECKGILLSWPIFKRITDTRLSGNLWSVAVKENHETYSCPECGFPFKKAVKNVADKKATVNICTHCQATWIDGEELQETTEALPPLPQKDDGIPLEAKQQLAIAMLELENRKEEGRETFEDGFQVKHLGLLFGPVEAKRHHSGQLPYVTYGLLVVVSILSLMVLYSKNSEGLLNALGYIPAKGLRYGGLTIITSFFLHANIKHLLENMYFLWLFGKNVERRLGWLMYSILLFVSSIVGNFVHTMFTLNKEALCIGASGAISGVLIFYCLAFYNEKMLILFTGGHKLSQWFIPRIIPVPALAVGAVWIFLQIVGSVMQMGTVSSLTHLGGITVGFIVWFILRNDTERMMLDDY